jgi:PIN domain nuclease of toxin-antitoxin system
MIVLDTHVWIWLINGSSELKPKVRTWIDKAAADGPILIPSICLWEVAMLASRGKIVTNKPVLQWLNEAITAPATLLAPLSSEVATESCNLPGVFHNDPADRLIVATARVEKAVLVTRDSRILEYGLSGNVKVHPV